MSTDYYKVLGIPQHANDEEIKEAYKKLALRFHPDRNTSHDAEDKFKEIGEAYRVLSDKKKRELFDRTVGPQTYHHARQGQSYQYKPVHHVNKANPVNINHIQFVYRTMNSNKERQHFPHFDDHEYADSSYNRYLYDRRWDKSSSRWIYTKKRDTSEYYAAMRRRGKILNLCITVITLGTIIGIVNYRLHPYSLNAYGRTSTRDRSSAGMFDEKSQIGFDSTQK